MPKTIKKQTKKAATPSPGVEKVISAFITLGKVYNVGRQGIITSFNGSRVGAWKWDTNRMMLSAVSGDTGKEFRKALRKMTSEGVMTTEVREKQGDSGEISTQIFYNLTELSKLSPGELDPIMKENGYFIIDSNLPILSEGDEGAEV